MVSFLIRRFLALIPLLLGISLLVFLLMYLAPGDFLSEARASRDIQEERIAQMEKDFGLDQPWYVQYGLWLKNMGTLNFGESWSYKIPVLDLIKQRVPATVTLALSSLLFAWCLAVPLGILAAIYKDSIFDRLSALLAYAALSIPEFFLALIAVYFAAVTGWFPTGGRSAIDHEFLPFFAQIGDLAYHLILPTIVLGIGSVASMMRIMRANFLDYLRAEFVTTARAKGVPEGWVMFKHVLRNAINPLLTALGFAFSGLLSGALLVENVMNYPGLGQLIFNAFLRQDQYVVMAAVVIGCVMLVTGNLIADLLLAWSDPRIRLEGKSGGTSLKGRLPWPAILISVGSLVAVLAGISIWQQMAGDSFESFLGLLKILLKGLGIFFALLCGAFALYLGYHLARRIGKPLLRRPLGLASVLVLGTLYFSALFAPLLAPYSVSQPNLEKNYHPPTRILWQDGGLQVQVYENVDPTAARYEAIPGQTVPLVFWAPSAPYKLFGLIPMEHKLFGTGGNNPADRVYLLGSDDTGRDIFSRLLFGAQISLSIGLIGISITLVMGFLVGGMSGYYGGGFDFIAMRMVEFLMAVPGLYLLLALRSALAPHFDSGQMYLVIVIILSFIGWAGTARIIRGMSLSIRNRAFVLAAESMGQPTLKILYKHILPNLMSYLLVAATLAIPGYILGEAALSFLGLGIQEPASSWGLMLKQADIKIFMLGFWWMLAPGFAIFITVISFNLLGDTLRDIVDPKMKV